MVARTHWVVGASIFLAAAVLWTALRGLPVVFNPRTFTISFTLGGLYLLTGALVWFGQPLGRILSYPCSALYLPRPSLGLQVFRIMGSTEFRAHFRRSRPRPDAESKRL